jgi:hypothetical protein
MSRSSGTYTAPTSGFKPAVEGAVVDSSDWNTLLDDLEAAVTETIYTGGLGATDNAMVRTDGTDTKKAQGSTPTISDTGVIAGVAAFLLAGYTIGTLPVGAEGQIAYASDWDKNGGASTGSLVFFDGEAWRGVDTGATTGTAPENTVLPVISGTLEVGQTLTTTNGTWLYTPTSYTYQWKDDGATIVGATNSTYQLTASEVGATITVVVTAHNASGATDATSAGVGPVADVTDPYFTDVILLLGFEDADGSTSTTDDSSKAQSMTFAGNAQTDTAQFKFGTSSLLLDGTGDHIHCSPAANDFALGTEFTVEARIRKNANGSRQNILGAVAGSIGQTGWQLYVDANDDLCFAMYDGGVLTTLTGTWAPSTGTWYHVAADRNASNVVRVYADGVMLNSATINYAMVTNNRFDIGLERGVGNYWNGWIDEARVTNGTARYNSDSGYTVPTDRFPRS